jgi:hypothetical protein
VKRLINFQLEAKKRKLQQAEDAVRDTGDVLSTYDPYNTKVYKGIYIGNNDSVDDSVSLHLFHGFVRLQLKLCCRWEKFPKVPL